MKTPALPHSLPLFALAGALSCAGAPAAGPHELRDQLWRVESFAADAGAVRQNIWDFAFDRDGSLWVAASGGLLRYDGYRWTHFGVEDGLPSHFVRTVLVTREGDLWVGTDKGAGVFRPRSGRPEGGWSFDPMGSGKGLAGPSVRRIVEDPDGTLWFCSDRWPDASASAGLSSYKDGRWRAYTARDGLASDHVYGYFRDSAGERFAMCKGGVRQQVGERWERPAGPSGIADADVWSMAEAPGLGVVARDLEGCFVLKGGDWRRVPVPSSRHVGMPAPLCGTRSGQILTCDFDGSSFGVFRWTGTDVKLVSPRIENRDHSVEFVREGPDGSIWFCAYGYLERWLRSGGEWTQYAALPFPQLIDGRGRIWFGDRTGAYLREHGRFRAVPEMAGSLALDGGGEVWSWTPGRPEIRRYGEAMRRYGENETGLRRVQWRSLDAKGRSWFHGLDAKGLNALAVFDGRAWTRISLSGLGRARIVDSSPDPVAGVWYLTVEPARNGVDCVHVDGGIRERFAREYGGIVYAPPHLTVDPSGRLWLSGQAGMYVLDPKAGGAWRRITGVAGNDVGKGVVRGDEIWFPYTGWTGGESGFAVRKDGAWRRFPGDYSDLFQLGADGTLYVGIDEGLDLVPPGMAGTPSQLTVPEGQRAHTLVEADGELWMGVVKPDGSEPTVLRYRPNHWPPRTAIDAISSGVRQDRRLDVSAHASERFVPRGRPRTYRYSWRFDSGPWSPFQVIPAGSIPVRGLEPGLHRFRLRAQDEALDADPAPAVAEFKVLPIPLQERPWFRPAVFVVLATIAGLATIAWERARRLVRANRELAAGRERLEERVAGRTAELSEANRRLGAEVAERKKAQEELEATQSRLLEASRLAGMAEVATGVLHNVGNVLNSVNVSAGIVRERVQGSRAQGLSKLSSLLKENAPDLGKFVTEDPRGRKVPEYLAALSEAVESERKEAIAELDNLRKNVEHIKGIVAMQQSYARVSGVVETQPIVDLVEDALRMNAAGFDRHGIELVRDYRDRPVASVDRHRAIQIIVNLVRNAKYACDEARGTDKRVTVRVTREGDRARIEVVDNGVGIAPDNLTRIFSHGFTTRKDGHGFGLHSGALAARELGGSLTVASEGPGKGASFTLEIPLSPPVTASRG